MHNYQLAYATQSETDLARSQCLFQKFSDYGQDYSVHSLDDPSLNTTH